jgi:hypothetical protein
MALPSRKETTIQSHRESISNSSVHNASVAATGKHPFNSPPFTPSLTTPHSPTISDHKSFHHLGKSTFTFRNQSPSTETTWLYQAPISRPQEPISPSQEHISRLQEPVLLSQEPVSRPQATRSDTFDTVMTDIQIGSQSQRSPLAVQKVELSSVSIGEHRASL